MLPSAQSNGVIGERRDGLGGRDWTRVAKVARTHVRLPRGRMRYRPRLRDVRLRDVRRQQVLDHSPLKEPGRHQVWCSDPLGSSPEVRDCFRRRNRIGIQGCSCVDAPGNASCIGPRNNRGRRPRAGEDFHPRRTRGSRSGTCRLPDGSACRARRAATSCTFPKDPRPW
jgi:hypothetical protein